MAEEQQSTTLKNTVKIEEAGPSRKRCHRDTAGDGKERREPAV